LKRFEPSLVEGFERAQVQWNDVVVCAVATSHDNNTLGSQD
jgi:hypothetical protein